MRNERMMKCWVSQIQPTRALTGYLCQLLTAAVLVLANTAQAQEAIRFGTPLKAMPSVQTDRMLPLLETPPSRDLAQGAEIVLVSGYEPAAGSMATVNVNRPGAKVLLVLTSYETLHWQVNAAPGTNLSAILVSGQYPSTVTTTAPTQGYLLKLPYAYETENANFKKLLAGLKSLLGIERVDVFRGSYAIPPTVGINALDPPRVELTLKGPAPKPPRTDFAFDLLTTDYTQARWTLAGPVGQEDKAYASEGKVAISASASAPASGKLVYRLNRDDQLEILETETGHTTLAALPPNFPRFSWAMDLAYDDKREIVSVVSLGGEGFLYRFDTKKRQWLDCRSLNNVDIFSMAYDRLADRYVAWTDQGDLLFISGEGAPLFTKKLASRLPGFGRLYDRGNARMPRLRIAAKKDDIALVYFKGNQVGNVWHYSVKTDEAVLTYARD